MLLVRWNGVHREVEGRWLRWATPDGVLLPTSGELTRLESLRADQEKQRADRLAARLRELGIDPDQPDF